jgi:hypothetical protein
VTLAAAAQVDRAAQVDLVAAAGAVAMMMAVDTSNHRMPKNELKGGLQTRPSMFKKG